MRCRLGCVVSLSLTPLAGAQGSVELATISTAGAPADNLSWDVALSGDGTCVAFATHASTLVPGPGAAGAMVLVRDRVAGTTTLASATWDGSAADQSSSRPSFSGDGRYVAFVSLASNLVTDDAQPGGSDLFVRDRAAGTTALVGRTSTGAQPVAGIPNGCISADGAWVVFETVSADVVPGDTNGVSDVFVRQLATGAVERVSRRGDGSQALLGSRDGTLSADGRFVAFASFDALLAADVDAFEDVYVLDRSTGVLVLASPTHDGSPSTGEATLPVLASSGAAVAFVSWDARLVPGDTNNAADAFWRDLSAGATGRASLRPGGAQIGSPGAWYPSISGDGRTVGYRSAAGVVPGVPAGVDHVYAHDRATGATTLVDAAPTGAPGDAGCDAAPQFSHDGRWVAFDSDAANLVVPDLHAGIDVFVRDRASDPPASYCAPKTSSLGCAALAAWSGTPSASGASAFTLTASAVVGGQHGLFFYGQTPQNVPFQGGRRCVSPPIRRTPVTAAGGSPGSCTGVLSFDFQAWALSGVDPLLVAGAVVHGQFWYRDPLDPAGFGSGLSDAVVFALRP